MGLKIVKIKIFEKKRKLVFISIKYNAIGPFVPLKPTIAEKILFKINV